MKLIKHVSKRSGFNSPREPLQESKPELIAAELEGSLAAEVLESTTDGVFMLDRNWCFIYLNSHARDLISAGRNLIGLNVWEEFPSARTLQFWDQYHIAMNERRPVQFISYYPAPLDLWFEIHAYPTRRGMSAYFRDITTRRAEEEKLRLLEQAISAAPMGVSLAKYDGSKDCALIYVNPAFERITGYSSEEAVGRDCRFLQGTDVMQPGRKDFRNAIENGRPATILVRNYKKDGRQFSNEIHLSQVYDQQGKVTHLVAIQNDISEQLEIKGKLAMQAQYDALTGLANRYLLLERLKEALDLASFHERQIAVVVVDLDNFKHINDRFGHMEGDRILIQIGRRLNAVVESTDTVGRLGGDEFALILTDWSDEGRLQKILNRILIDIRKPLFARGQELWVTGSVGVSIFPVDGSQAEDLLLMADLAMYWIKRCGKNSFHLYSPDLRFNHNEPLDVAVGFRSALKNREFRLFYQPRVSADTRQVNGFEALIRWQHPKRGLLLPAQFIRIAEDTGLINEIGRWVIEEALLDNAAWRKAGHKPVTISVNVSAAQIQDPEFPNAVGNALRRSGLPAESLELELTESLLIDNAELAEASLRALKQLGVRIAIDDFGAGYSGLHYLSRFPIDAIKIDHFFTKNIATDDTAATICRSVLKLGQALGLTTVAEGVEAESQVSLLRSWQCSELQGYLFAKPLPLREAELFLIASSAPANSIDLDTENKPLTTSRGLPS
jgi:diguanylate cyclase (GGDEF)-like protein/PAS domain S-box-containing protein